ncbi:lysozyme inhibitor LprI family protein [Pseudomonas viridiflava]|uniref:lysozyme inhibitor LprI family protein n=1 Tax=Pseudomonas viridiflava TaxID=33069 RepID=UPI000F08739F|nr:lysozyme inhibitor LprI family protein [Pseudomonas viridiflava]
MKINCRFVLVLVSLYFLPAHAECVNSDTSREVDACAKTEKNTADARLNDSYKKLIARAKGQYRSDTRLGDEFLAKLKDSQRAWLRLRDTNCPLEAFEIEVGQATYLTTVNNCVAWMSLERAAYLDKILPDISEKF